MRIPVLASLLFVVTSLEASQVYVWTDENGKKHFSDTPPAEQTEVKQETYQVQNVDGGYPHTDPDSYKHIQESWADKKKREKLEQAEYERRKQEYMRGPCQEAQQRLSLLQGPVAFFDDDGKEIRVSEAQRRQEVTDLTADIRKYCK
jgi:hypothetical protein